MNFENTSIPEGMDSIQDMISPVDSDRLEIVVPDEYKGKYELPVPASNAPPEWYKSTDMIPSDDNPLQKSVRACMPFMEAMNFGWLVPVPTDVSIVQKNGDVQVEWDDQGFEVVGSHPKSQVGGDEFPHDGEIIKFNLPYLFRTPEGVSTLYMPPLNRIETRFRPFSGVVETDNYVNRTNIPSLLLDDDFSGVIEAGTPLVQVIPFERDSLVNESEIRTPTDKEAEMVDRTSENVPAVDAYYKEEVWEPKKASRDMTRRSSSQVEDGE